MHGWCQSLSRFLCALLLALQSAALCAQEAEPQQQTITITGGFRGIGNCSRCHNSGQSSIDELRPVDDFVLLNEAPIWSSQDKHREAFAVLVGSERIARMEKLLGWQAGQAARDKRCLSCHVGLPLAALPTESPDNPHLIPESLLADSRIYEGVACEICHGPNQAPDDRPAKDWWYELHTNPGNTSDAPWRFLSPAEKLKAGFTDVRTPSAQARLCLSCHIGDAEQGRVLTHDMYAAGHPPLPSFELVTFAQQEPLHWRRLPSKQMFESFDATWKARTGQALVDRPDQLYQTKLLLINALVSQQQSWKLIAALTQAGEPADTLPLSIPADARPHWPELAVMECYQCHHDLHEPSWRQQRPADPKLPVGRPGQREWPRILAELAAQALDSAQGEGAPDITQTWTDITQKVDAAMLSRPFGHREQLHAACTNGVTILEEMIQSLEQATWQADDATKLLKQLASNQQQRRLEYDSARQIAWAAQVISSEMVRLKVTEPSQQPQLTLPFTGTDVAWLLLPARSGVDTLPRKVNFMGPRLKDFEVHDIDLSKTLPRILDYEIQNGKRAP